MFGRGGGATLHLPPLAGDSISIILRPIAHLDEQDVGASGLGLAQHGHGLAVTVKLEEGESVHPAQEMGEGRRRWL